jgi:hypothetical protein
MLPDGTYDVSVVALGSPGTLEVTMGEPSLVLE